MLLKFGNHPVNPSVDPHGSASQNSSSVAVDFESTIIWEEKTCSKHFTRSIQAAVPLRNWAYGRLWLIHANFRLISHLISPHVRDCSTTVLPPVRARSVPHSRSLRPALEAARPLCFCWHCRPPAWLPK